MFIQVLWSSLLLKKTSIFQIIYLQVYIYSAVITIVKGLCTGLLLAHTCTVADIARGFLRGDFGLSTFDSLTPDCRLIGAELGRIGRLF